MELPAIEHEINAHHVILGLLLVVGEQPALEHEVARVEEGPADLPAAVAHHPALVVHGRGLPNGGHRLGHLGVLGGGRGRSVLPGDAGRLGELPALGRPGRRGVPPRRRRAQHVGWHAKHLGPIARRSGRTGGEGKQRGRERLQGWPGGRRAVAVFDID